MRIVLEPQATPRHFSLLIELTDGSRVSTGCTVSWSPRGLDSGVDRDTDWVRIHRHPGGSIFTEISRCAIGTGVLEFEPATWLAAETPYRVCKLLRQRPDLAGATLIDERLACTNRVPQQLSHDRDLVQPVISASRKG